MSTVVVPDEFREDVLQAGTAAVERLRQEVALLGSKPEAEIQALMVRAGFRESFALWYLRRYSSDIRLLVPERSLALSKFRDSQASFNSATSHLSSQSLTALGLFLGIVFLAMFRSATGYAIGGGLGIILVILFIRALSATPSLRPLRAPVLEPLPKVSLPLYPPVSLFSDVPAPQHPFQVDGFPFPVPGEFTSETSRASVEEQQLLVADVRGALSRGVSLPKLSKAISDAGWSAAFADWLIGEVQDSAPPLTPTPSSAEATSASPSSPPYSPDLVQAEALPAEFTGSDSELADEQPVPPANPAPVSDSGSELPEEEPVSTVSPVSVADIGTQLEQLERLASLRDKGALTTEEFNAAKQRVLGVE